MNFINKITVMLVAFGLVIGMNSNSALAEGGVPVVNYRTHVQNEGWQDWKSDEEMSGTSGKGLRLEGIEVKLSGDMPAGAKIEYRTHVENKGWETAWSADGETAGSQGQGLRLEGIQIRLVNMLGYSVKYRTHVQNVGWETTWASNGSTAGTQGKGLRLEGIEIKIVKNDQNHTPDLTAYQEKLAVIENTNQADYTRHSWDNLINAIENHNVTAGNTQEEIDAATAAITEALALLVHKSTELGNTPGNLINGGSVVLNDGTTYLSMTYHSDLYRIGADGLRTSIFNFEKHYHMRALNAKDGWIYYVLHHGHGGTDSLGLDGLYRIKIDGSENTLLSQGDLSRLTLCGDQLFVEESRKLYTMDLDCKDKKMVIPEFSYFYTIYNGLIYYIANDKSIHRIELDGTNDRIVLNDKSIRKTMLLIDGNYLYFNDPTVKNSPLYRSKLDGSELERISTDNVGCFNIVNGSIYYGSNTQAVLKKMNMDGTEVKVLSSMKASDIGINYGNRSDVTLQVTSIGIINDQLYYTVADPYDSVVYFKINCNGENNERL